MVRFRRLILLALPVSLLSATMARGNESSSSSTPGITREDQREERFYNFDNGRQSGGGFKDPSDLIRRLRNTRNLQYATDPAKTVDAALEDFVWPDESPPEEDSENSEEVVEEVEEEEADNSTPPVTTP
ncbi:MAG: hypothetical protein TQ37_08720 [Candidatus Synechococcus spongiarum 15L]|uniref:Uncharacterized protein n=2 Tax=Candidatus Synechococcus spongiarum TaxID=431041 RepID=A0A1T1CRT4_9SYNE|nr:MAG: hypothetical protein TQ37_08720 [Candidatus Synechococcus spongiarum 15L]OOV31158.1 hypothetical protein BV61_05220 [Candidatus Synechococcus spongiarum LMB bulk15M]